MSLTYDGVGYDEELAQGGLGRDVAVPDGGHDGDSEQESLQQIFYRDPHNLNCFNDQMTLHRRWYLGLFMIRWTYPLLKYTQTGWFLAKEIL